MKKYFRDWSKFEIILILISIISIIVSGIIFNSYVIVTISSIISVVTALLQAKGKIESQFFALIECLLYAMVSYFNRYYGEVIFSLIFMLPMTIGAIISWITHKNVKTDTVEVNEVKLREWILLAFTSVIVFIGAYNILKYFNTSELLVSTISIIASLIAVYLLARRSKYCFIFYLINDIILIILWGLPVISGELLLIPMVINPLTLFINDAYGSFNWNRMEKEQTN